MKFSQEEKKKMSEKMKEEKLKIALQLILIKLFKKTDETNERRELRAKNQN